LTRGSQNAIIQRIVYKTARRKSREWWATANGYSGSERRFALHSPPPHRLPHKDKSIGGIIFVILQLPICRGGCDAKHAGADSYEQQSRPAAAKKSKGK
jgi:hypothetical protein